MITNLIQKDFEQAINQGNQSLIEKHMSQYGKEGVFKLLNTRLPSGELPLHLAIRRNFPKITKLFLEKGANPLVKDIQRMQAIDHASFSTNPLHKAYLLSAATGTSFQKIQQQMQCKAPGAETKLKKHINFYKSAGFSFFTPHLGKEVFNGNILNVNADNINTADAFGLTPIHYAILRNDPKILQELLALGADVKVLGPNGDSLLHIAALRNTNPQILYTLFYRGLKPDIKNDLGQTPMHYASIEDNLVAMQALAQLGAQTDIKDSQGVAPLALVGSFVSERDPLKITFEDFIYPLFIGTTILLPIAMEIGWIPNDSANLTMQAVSLIGTYLPKALLARNVVQMFFPAPPNEKTGIYSYGSLLDQGCFIAHSIFSSYLPSWLQTGLSIWYSYKILREAQQGLQTCYQNVGYRSPLQIGMKGFLHLLTASPTLLQIYLQSLLYFNTTSLQGIPASLQGIPASIKAYTQASDKKKAENEKTKAGRDIFEYYTKLGKKATDVTPQNVEEELWPLIENNLTKNDLRSLWRCWAPFYHTDKNKSNPSAERIFTAGGTIFDCLTKKFAGNSCVATPIR